MDLKRLEHYREYFNKQKGRKYPCSNQIVRCAIVTNDRDKAIDLMSDKEVVKKLERKDYAAWLLENNGCGVDGMKIVEGIDFIRLLLIKILTIKYLTF